MKYSYNISVTHGGEDLKITPVVVTKSMSGQTLQFYNASEFEPMNLERINGFSEEWVTVFATGLVKFYRRAHNWPTLRWITLHFHKVFRRTRFVTLPKIANFFRIVKNSAKEYWRHPDNIMFVIKVRLRNSYPVWCKKIHPELALVTLGQLSVNDPNGIAEEYYLTPSQATLKTWYEDRLIELQSSEYESERQLYKLYMELVYSLDSDEEINYIAELDT